MQYILYLSVMNAATWPLAITRTILKRRTTLTNKAEPKAQRQLLLVSAFHVQNWKSEDTPLIRTLQQILYLSVMNAATWPSPGQF